MMITGRTRTFAILGDPVTHSLSPVMQNAAFRALGLDAVYIPLRCEPSEVPGLMMALARNGGGGNVTIPHKGVAAATVERPSSWVRAIAACNTFWCDDGDPGVHGDNTDIEGILAAVDRLDAPDGPWLVAGTGGSARAVAAAACERGVALAAISRDTTRQAGFQSWATHSLGVRIVEPAECRVVVNATPVGLAREEADPVALETLPRVEAVLDLVYASGRTGFVRRARARGLSAEDGREVLVRQGAAAFTRWFPELQPPVEVMRSAVNGALG